jgi:CheY-like chemotaxis protein
VPAPRHLRVLLIDDNLNVRKSLKLALQVLGLTVEEAEDGEQGLKLLLGGAYDAAVVDIAMPGLDGFEVARRVRASPMEAKLRLIALSGFGQQTARENAKAAGFDQFLVKPVDPEHLAAALADSSATRG